MQRRFSACQSLDAKYEAGDDDESVNFQPASARGPKRQVFFAGCGNSRNPQSLFTMSQAVSPILPTSCLTLDVGSLGTEDAFQHQTARGPGTRNREAGSTKSRIGCSVRATICAESSTPKACG
jgi:hypothetical protein